MFNRIFLYFLYPLTIFLIALTFLNTTYAQSDDEAAIKKCAMMQAEAWNKHDAAAYAALFTENCDVVNVQMHEQAG